MGEDTNFDQADAASGARFPLDRRSRRGTVSMNAAVVRRKKRSLVQPGVFKKGLRSCEGISSRNLANDEIIVPARNGL